MQAPDGGYVVIGTFGAQDSDTDGYLFKIRPEARNIRVDFEAHDFGDVMVNESSDSFTFTVENNGSTDLTLGQISIEGNDSTEFEISRNTCTNTLTKDGAKCEVDVIFTPASTLPTPNKNTTLVIPSDDPDTETDEMTIELTGNATTQPFTLTAQVNGSGTITDTGGLINCGTGGTDCEEIYNSGTTVTLSAEADPGSVLSEWSGGGCSGNGDCIVTITGDTTVTATFTDEPTGVPPAPDIKVNGVDNDMVIKRDMDILITVSLDPGDWEGSFADMWLLSETPGGWHFYEYDEIAGTGEWINDYYPFWQGELDSAGTPGIADSITIYDTAAMATPPDVGIYTFYFAIDDTMNGVFDNNEGSLFIDSLELDIMY